MTCLKELDVVILAGGLGTRLRPLFPYCPKVMVPVNDKPFVRYLIEQVQSFGARRIILALGYLAEVVQEYVESQKWKELEIITFVESDPRGTGGALRSVLPLIKSKTALVMNGDSFTKVDLCRFLEFHKSRPALLSMVLTYLPNTERYGVVETDDDGLVKSYMEKPISGQSGGYINAGLYFIEKTAIRKISPEQQVSLERDVFPCFCNRGFYAMKGEFPFIDIGTPESYSLAHSFFGGETHDY